ALAGAALWLQPRSAPPMRAARPKASDPLIWPGMLCASFLSRRSSLAKMPRSRHSVRGGPRARGLRARPLQPRPRGAGFEARPQRRRAARSARQRRPQRRHAATDVLEVGGAVADHEAGAGRTQVVAAERVQADA